MALLGSLLLPAAPALADQPPPLGGYPTVTIQIDRLQDIAEIRGRLMGVMNRHDFDLRGEGHDRVTFNVSHRQLDLLDRAAPEPLPDDLGGPFHELWHADQHFTQVAIDYVPDLTRAQVQVVARPTFYAITHGATQVVDGREVQGTLIDAEGMRHSHYARLLQRELEVIKAAIEHPAAPVIHHDLFP